MSEAWMPLDFDLMTLARIQPVHRTLHHWLDRVAATALDVLLPPVCPLCGDFVNEIPSSTNLPSARSMAGVIFCPHCAAALRNWPEKLAACPRCALPRPGSDHDAACNRCKPLTFHFDRALAAGVYQGAMAEAVIAAKSPRNAALASQLGRWLSLQTPLPDLDPRPDFVTWVPAHILRKMQRKGTPGVELMAQQVAQRLKIPSLALLRTIRYVQKQALLDDKSRLLNVRGAFALKKSYAWRGLPNLRDRHILLVDDVLTTGATASEIAKVLRHAGASQVTLAVLARAVRD